jgi:hypothetical protein
MAQGRLAGGKSMQVIGLFVVCVFILNACAVLICTLVERHSSFAGLITFLGFFIVNMVIAWKIALTLTEKFLVSDAQKKANEEHMTWVNSLFPARR